MCQNVLISKYLNRSRYLNMNCLLGEDNLFSLKANLNEKFNILSGNFKNFDTKILSNNWLKQNLNFIKNDVNSYHGNIN